MVDHYLSVHHVELGSEQFCVDPAVNEDECGIVSLYQVVYECKPRRSLGRSV